MKRWREPDGTIHADGADGQGSTLCGRALEGDGDSTEQELKEVHRGRVNCPHCVAIVNHCKRIPARFLTRPVLTRATGPGRLGPTARAVP